MNALTINLTIKLKARDLFLRLMGRMRNRHCLIADAVIFATTPSLALLLRVNSLDEAWASGWPLLYFTVFAGLVKLVSFHRFGLYNRSWRHATVEDLVAVGRGVGFASFLVILASYLSIQFTAGWYGFPRTVPLIDAGLTLIIAGGMRFGLRFVEHNWRRPSMPAQESGERRRVLVVGAGVTGQAIVKEFRNNSRLNKQAIGFLDDDSELWGLKVQGHPVFGPPGELTRVAREERVDEVIIAMPRASGTRIREIAQSCEKVGVPAKTVPSVHEILDGSVTVNQLRNVQIEDLLRREPVATDMTLLQERTRGRRVMVTGGGGSIGRELCRQLLRCRPAELIILGHGENSVFETVAELLDLSVKVGETGPRPKIRSYIADIRSARRMRHIVDECKPDIIFHAAAHKHVPLMEENPVEAVSNNIFGTRNVLDAAVAAGVPQFVLISTDKAVNPTSLMGVSKRVAELLVLDAARRSGNAYVAVRFGNVLGSRGSVVLTFKKQIAAGGPVTVSHPDMTRFFMTIPEAVHLVLEASVLGSGGEVFVLDMGEPVRILDLASDLIRLSGLEVGSDVDIVFTGMRPGEKLTEELFVRGERYEPTGHHKILLARNTDAAFRNRDLESHLAALSVALDAGNSEQLVRVLRRLVPEFSHDSVRLRQPEAQPDQDIKAELPAGSRPLWFQIKPPSARQEPVLDS